MNTYKNINEIKQGAIAVKRSHYHRLCQILHETTHPTALKKLQCQVHVMSIWNTIVYPYNTYCYINHKRLLNRNPKWKDFTAVVGFQYIKFTENDKIQCSQPTHQNINRICLFEWNSQRFIIVPADEFYDFYHSKNKTLDMDLRKLTREN